MDASEQLLILMMGSLAALKTSLTINSQDSGQRPHNINTRISYIATVISMKIIMSSI